MRIRRSDFDDEHEERKRDYTIVEYTEADDNVRALIRTNLLPVREYLYSYQFYFMDLGSDNLRT